MPAPSASALGRMGLWGPIVPDLDRDFSGKTPADAVPISVVIDQKDLRLIRPRTLKVIWWLMLGATWLCL